MINDKERKTGGWRGTMFCRQCNRTISHYELINGKFRCTQCGTDRPKSFRNNKIVSKLKKISKVVFQ